jgi:phospholipid/cholesterol/gamma-HCH transport system ATP-binding protein
VCVENLTAGYGETLIIDNISFEVDRGEVFVILGGSGSGKSTILKQMIGLYKPMSGKILINGQDIISAEGEERLQILSEIGVMYQRGALFGSMTLLENARLPL